MKRDSVLIIKHGYSETCDHNISPHVSFGDVFRCTCLLEDFRGYHVTWITTRAAQDLLMDNHLIDELILADSPADIPKDNLHDHYNIVINLEKQKDWCEFTAQLSADKHFGFRDWTSGHNGYYPESSVALALALTSEEYQPCQETLFHSVGREWNGQRYVLGYHPNPSPQFDIGLNNHVGPKWPNKRWPDYHWERLYFELSKKYSVCWQQSLDSIRHYIDWLASCRLIITCDSLGLHLSLALGRKIIALFGPTPPEQVYMYGCGQKITPLCDRHCIPCFQSKCHYDHTCMEYISVEMVLDAVKNLIDPGKTNHETMPPQVITASKAVIF